MAKQQTQVRAEPTKKRTSIGSSVRSKPTNKSKRASWKRYRGQGR